MIGSLLYLTASWPNILFSIFLCARFQSDPRESHLTTVKRILRYLKGTTNVGLFFRRSKDFKLVGYCDADFAGDRVERKSTSGSCQFLGENLISWYSKKQSTIALDVVLRCSRWRANWKIIKFVRVTFLSSVVILLLFAYLKPHLTF